MDVRHVVNRIGRGRAWKIETIVVGMVVSTIATKLIRAVYGMLRRDKSPDAVFDMRSTRFSWPDALMWAAAGGIGLGLAKVLSGRLAAFGWEAATGTVPPGSDDAAKR